ELTDSGAPRTRWMRSQTCIVAYSTASAAQAFERDAQPDEYMVLVPDPGQPAVLEAGDDQVTVTGPALAIMPPGSSSVTMPDGGTVVRLFTTVADDLVTSCENAGFYAEPDANVAEFAPWPAPADGHRIRSYALDDIEPEEGRFGRLFRCSTLMVNYFYPDPGPRDPAKMSPHHHDDFEQISLQLAGDYIHHIRTPWTPDMGAWRDDDHQFCESPAVTVIPPPSVHTSQSVGDEMHQLVDIFCPPRVDFSERPGWVLNAEEYPTP
ncbi:MAG: hypothetical protein P8N02_03895, partial [Actinomycetota bacterium]|nr:hypothetical protein [Actinomycetota bacterium]